MYETVISIIFVAKNSKHYFHIWPTVASWFFIIFLNPLNLHWKQVLILPGDHFVAQKTPFRCHWDKSRTSESISVAVYHVGVEAE